MRHSVFPLLIWMLMAGCIGAPPPAQHFSHTAALLPAGGLITQRAIFTARGRQFTLDGYVALDPAGDLRLVVLETFGHVMADVLIKADGSVFVMQSSRILPPRWIRRYVAADLECIFGQPTRDCPVVMPEPNHFMVKRRCYSLDLKVIGIKPGPQPANMFDETGASRL